jgi:hypothetical protein
LLLVDAHGNRVGCDAAYMVLRLLGMADAV